MLYWYKKHVECQEFSGDKEIFVLAKLENNQTSAVTDLIEHKEIFDRIKLTDGIKVAVIPGSNVPVFTVQNANSEYDVSAVAGLLFKKFDALGSSESAEALQWIKKISTIVANQLNNSEIAKEIVYALKIQYDWEHTGALQNPFTVSAIDFDKDLITSTSEVLTAINNKFTNALSSIKAIDNVTHFQERYDDKLFVEIPSRQAMEEADSMYQLMPKPEEICIPYSDKAAYTPTYKVMFANNPSILRDIEGSRQNNVFEIFENEKMYYDALNEWCQFNMKEQFGTVDGEIIDINSKSYIFELITLFYMLHWRHSIHVPDAIDDSEDDDDNSSYTSRFVFYGKDSSINGVVVLDEFLKEASAELGYTVYLKALMQMARWGERKPTAIVFDGFDREFDLVSGCVRSKVGDIRDYNVVMVDGKESRFVGVIKSTKPFRDSSAKVDGDLIVGYVTETIMKNAEDTQICLPMYYHAIDFIGLLKENKISVAGISFDGRECIVESESDIVEVTTAELLKEYEMNKDTMMQYPFYRSDAFIDLFTKRVKNSTGQIRNLFSVIDTRSSDPDLVGKAGMANFYGYDNVLAIVADTKIPINSTAAVVEYGIMNRVLPVFQRVSENHPSSIADSISIWNYALDVFEGLPSLDDSKPRPVKTEVQTTERATSFGSAAPVQASAQAQVQQPVQTQPVVQSQPAAQPTVQPSSAVNKGTGVDTDWYRVVPADAEVQRIVDHNGNTVAYCMVEVGMPQKNNTNNTYSRYTIVQSADGRPVTEGASVSAFRLFALTLHNIYLSTTGSSLRQIYFENGQALTQFRNEMQTLSKQ